MPADCSTLTQAAKVLPNQGTLFSALGLVLEGTQAQVVQGLDDERDSGPHDLFEMLGRPSKLTSIDVSQNEASAQAMLVLEAALLGTASSLQLIQLDANPLGFDRG